MKILHVVHSLDLGGIETFVMNVYRKTDIREVQFDFLVLNNKKGFYEEEILSKGGKIFKISLTGSNYIKNRNKMNDFFEKYAKNYSSIHYHASNALNILPLSLAYKHGIPQRIIHSHSSNILNPPFKRMFKICIHKLNKIRLRKLANYFISCSDKATNWLFNDKIKNSNNYILLENGIDMDKYKYDNTKRMKTREQLDISNNQFVLGHVGRFSKVKNHEYILQVFKEVHKNNNKSILLLIGNGPLKQEILRKIQNLHLQDNVIILSDISDVDDYYQAMDMFIFPSFYEGLPLTLIEAQVSGLQVISSNKVDINAKITSNIKFLDINENPKIWANEIKNSNFFDRLNVKILNNSYDIKTVKDKLLNIYIKSGYIHD